MVTASPLYADVIDATLERCRKVRLPRALRAASSPRHTLRPR